MEKQCVNPPPTVAFVPQGQVSSTKVVLRRDYPKFKGRENCIDIGISAIEWIEKLEHRFVADNITEDDKKISEAKSAVDADEGNAKHFLPTLKNNTWNEFKKIVVTMNARGDRNQRYYVQQLIDENW